jgi:DNA transposition AAA+ family ATPase
MPTLKEPMAAWDEPPKQSPSGSEDDLARWQRAREELILVAKRNNWRKTNVTNRSGIPPGTLYPWFDGSYNGVLANVTERVEAFLRSVNEMSAASLNVPVVPGYIETPTARELADRLMYAQLMPSMVVITLAAGMGKTFGARHYRDNHPNVILVTMRPTTKSMQRMLAVIRDELDLSDKSPTGLERSIGRRLKRNGRQTLLMVDEAQNLTDESVNQLRYFLDEYGVGIALLGNLELYGRWGTNEPKPAYAQLHRRIGMRMKVMAPTALDIDAVIDGWGIEDAECRKLCHALGRKPGALGQITETLKLAIMYANGAGRELKAEDILAATRNRGVVEGLGHA